MSGGIPALRAASGLRRVPVSLRRAGLSARVRGSGRLHRLHRGRDIHLGQVGGSPPPRPTCDRKGGSPAAVREVLRRGALAGAGSRDQGPVPDRLGKHRLLEEIAAELAKLPGDHAPTRHDWSRLSRKLTTRIDQRIAEPERLKAGLTESCRPGRSAIGRRRLWSVRLPVGGRRSSIGVLFQDRRRGRRGLQTCIDRGIGSRSRCSAFALRARSARTSATATERSSRARSGPSRRRTAGSSPKHSPVAGRPEHETDRPAPRSLARARTIGAARDSVVGADRRHRGPVSTPRADYCLDKGASTEAASTRCASVAGSGCAHPTASGDRLPSLCGARGGSRRAADRLTGPSRQRSAGGCVVSADLEREAQRLGH